MGRSMRDSLPRVNFKLQTKLTLLIEGLIIFIVVVTGLITTMRERETLENELRKRGIALVNDLAKFSARPILGNDLATLRRFVNHSINQDYVRYVIILDPKGRVIMHNDLGEVGKFYHDSISKLAINSQDSGYAPVPFVDQRGERYCNIFAPIIVSEVRLGTIIIGYSCMAAEKEISHAQHQIFLIGLITVILGGGIAYLLSAYISTPIRKITDAMENVSTGDLDPVLSIKRNDEIGTLAKSFNTMAEDLGRHRKHLEILVEARTAELRKANEKLQQEISERTRAEAELKRSQEQLRDLASHLQFIREEERTQIAREIHDELGQALTALKMDVHWLNHKLPEDQPLLTSKIKSMSRLIDTTVQSVRRISSELRPKLLDDLGLSAAMEWQANEFMSRAGITCDISSEPEDIILDQARSTAFFRIFQETLTNIARHAYATHVEVMLQEFPEAVELIVRDNGQGITESQIANAKSLGIIGMRERVHSLGGDLKITGVPNKGTTVAVRIPLGQPGGSL
jgi:signal transduction histidine kinase